MNLQYGSLRPVGEREEREREREREGGGEGEGEGGVRDESVGVLWTILSLMWVLGKHD